MLTFDIKIYDLACTFPKCIGRITLISSDMVHVDVAYNYGVVPYLDTFVSIRRTQLISVQKPAKFMNLWICLMMNNSNKK